MLIGKADAFIPARHPEVMSRGTVLEQAMVREQAAECEQRWHPAMALLLRVSLSLVLWGLIVGGLDWAL